MNYRERIARRQLQAKLRRESDRATVLIGVESVMVDYEEAVQAITGRKVTLLYRHGYIIGAGPKQLTVSQLADVTRMLWASAHVTELDNPASSEID